MIELTFKRRHRRAPPTLVAGLLLAFLMTEAPVLGQAPTTGAGNESPAQLARRAAERFAEDDLPGAVDFYRRAAAATRDMNERASLLINAAWLEHLQKKSESASILLRQARSAAPDFPFERSLYGADFVAMWEQGAVRRVDQRRRDVLLLIQQAVQAMTNDQNTTARDLLDRALQIDPNDSTALYNRALVDVRLGESELAIARLQQIITAANASRIEISSVLLGRTLNELGALQLEAELPSEAIVQLERSVDLAPENGAAWNNLGLAREQLGQPDRAVVAYRAAIERLGDQATLIANLGRALRLTGDLTGAIDRLVRATETDPRAASAYYELGQARLDKKQPDLAVAAFDRALDLGLVDSQKVLALKYLARARYETKSWDLAAKAAREATEIEASDPAVWNYLGMAERQLGNFDEAVNALTRATSLAPDRADLANNLGDAYFADRRYREAQSSFQRALDLDPGFGAAERNLALVQARLAAAPPTDRVAKANRRRAGEVVEDNSRRGRRGKKKRGQTSVPPFAPGVEFADGRHPETDLAAVRVRKVEPQGPADRAGIRPGDFILRFEGAPINSATELARLFRAIVPGATVSIDLYRGNTATRVEISRAAR